MLILKRATSHLGFSRWKLSKERSPALMARKASDHKLPLAETLREAILNLLNAAKSHGHGHHVGRAREARRGDLLRQLGPYRSCAVCRNLGGLRYDLSNAS